MVCVEAKPGTTFKTLKGTGQPSHRCRLPILPIFFPPESARRRETQRTWAPPSDLGIVWFCAEALPGVNGVVKPGAKLVEGGEVPRPGGHKAAGPG